MNQSKDEQSLDAVDSDLDDDDIEDNEENIDEYKNSGQVDSYGSGL